MKYTHLSLERLKTPTNGTLVFTDRYWLVTPQNEVLFFRSYTCPQCNSNKEIAERILGERIAEGYRVEYVPVAYVPFDPSDWRE